MASRNRTHVSIRKETKARMDSLCERLMTAYEQGRTDVEYTEQGERGAWVSADTLINKLLDQYDAHAARSRKAADKRRKQTTN